MAPWNGPKKVKGSKVLPITNIGPGANPGVQAVIPQVTLSHPPSGRLPLLSSKPAVTFIAFTRWSHPYMVAHIRFQLTLTYRPGKDERLSWPSCLTCCGWFTHNRGHPSAVSQVWDRESLPSRQQHSTTVPRDQLLIHEY